MATTTNRETLPHDEGSVDSRLARLLDTAFCARVVPHLAPETLHQLIRYRGLEACGELITAATPTQLTAMLDLDLWRRPQPGRDELFDVDRFGEWLEVLVETGESVAARTVASLDPHLVTVGLSRYVRLFDLGSFEPVAASDDEPMDRNAMMNSEATGNVLECEVGGYLMRARRTDAWDAIVALLATLEIEHNVYFHAVMHGCLRLSDSKPELDGLDDLLTAPEQQLHDVAIERDRRRSRQGYATPADARAFLEMARRPQPTRHDAIARAYFRATEEEDDSAPEETSADAPDNASQDDAGASARGDSDIPTSIDAVTELLAEAGVTPERPRALLEAADEDVRATKLPVLKRLLESVLQRDETTYLARTRELAFLANTLLAGGSVQSRPFTPQEASDAAACVCNLGLECWPARWPDAGSHMALPPEQPPTAAPDGFLAEHDLVTAFEVGWSVLFKDVSLFVADQLVLTLADLHPVDGDMRRGLRALRNTLQKQRKAGTPWLARDAAEVLATLDVTAWSSVLGLLDECPILTDALRAVLERRTTSVSATAFDFISTKAQIGDVRVFMRTLPNLLSQ